MCARQHRSRLGQLTFHAPTGFRIGATFLVRSGAMARAKRDDDGPDGRFFRTAQVAPATANAAGYSRPALR